MLSILARRVSEEWVHDTVCDNMPDYRESVAEFTRIPAHWRAAANRNSGEVRYEELQTASYTHEELRGEPSPEKGRFRVTAARNRFLRGPARPRQETARHRKTPSGNDDHLILVLKPKKATLKWLYIHFTK